MPLTEDLTTTLQQAGLRITPQRIAICRLLSETDTHPTAAMIYKHVRAQYPSFSMATVYNTLDALIGLGAVNVLGGAGDDSVHYDADTSPHINLACISCHKIVDIDSQQVSNIDHEISNRSGYKILGARILYYGFCPDCQTSTV